MSPSALRRQVGQLLIAGFNGIEIPVELRSLAHEFGLGGVILFARNIVDVEQVAALCFDGSRLTSDMPAWVSVDQEGGRVARLKNPFTAWPPMATLGRSGDVALAERFAHALATEMRAVGITLDYAPVLDVHTNPKNPVIGDRALAENAKEVARLGAAIIRAMQADGVAACGKHFPGHGGVIADSHLETPYDERSDIFEQDMAIFKAQIDAGILDAMMPAHVIFPNYDSQPASGSEYWLKQVLRQQLGFKGLVFSDDLTMEGAAIMGSPAERGAQALKAGCDMLLMCNKREAHIEVLDNLPVSTVPLADALLKKQSFSLSDLKLSQEWKAASEAMKRLTS
mgnify:CR=1 FL=1